MLTREGLSVGAPTPRSRGPRVFLGRAPPPRRRAENASGWDSEPRRTFPGGDRPRLGQWPLGGPWLLAGSQCPAVRVQAQRPPQPHGEPGGLPAKGPPSELHGAVLRTDAPIPSLLTSCRCWQGLGGRGNPHGALGPGAGSRRPPKSPLGPPPEPRGPQPTMKPPGWVASGPPAQKQVGGLSERPIHERAPTEPLLPEPVQWGPGPCVSGWPGS